MRNNKTEGTETPTLLDTGAVIEIGQSLLSNLSVVMRGAEEAKWAAAVAVLSGGHLLIEDVPGVGKTVLARAIAASLGSDLTRVQGHADLLPSDVTGVSVYAPDTKVWEFCPGPVFSRVVLFDELNRTPPRTQSALLETMEEQQVTVDGESWPLPRPHMVIATQNPLSQKGTYPLVESQLDRFSMSTSVGYPSEDDETLLVMGDAGRAALDDVDAICSPDQWWQAQALTNSVTVKREVAEYAVQLCRSTRKTGEIRLGVSPRASIWLLRSAQAQAILMRRSYVVPDDVKAVAVGSLSHRVVLHEGGEDMGRSRHLVASILDSVPAPKQ